MRKALFFARRVTLALMMTLVMTVAAACGSGENGGNVTVESEDNTNDTQAENGDGDVLAGEEGNEVASSGEPAPTETPIPVPTEPPHTHTYTETITKEPTCTAEGTKTFACDCGDSYTEPIGVTEHDYAVLEGSAVAATCTADGKKADMVCECGDTVEGEVVKATGHTYGEYVSNGDATYDADGTKTAECSVCGEKDTVTDADSKLERPKEPNLYGMTFEDWGSDKTFYIMENTNLYFEPSLQSPVVGHLSINDEVKIISWASNASEIYPPYDGTEKPTDISWKYINYNGQTGYVPYDYTWKTKRDTSITLNPLYANYPTVGGGGSGLFYPYEKEWRYVYGCNSRKTIYLHPQLSSVNIYDGIGLNVIATITDSSIKFETTGNAYATSRDDVGSYYIYEIYYNGGIAYMDSLKAIRE